MLYHSHALAMPPDTRHSSAVVEEGVDQFSKKILTSGYNLKQVRKISINGIRGWERKLERGQKSLQDIRWQPVRKNKEEDLGKNKMV